MRWPFTPYGTSALVACSLPLAALGLWLGGRGGLLWLVVLPPLAFVLWFFRDPERTADGGEDDLVAPADGVVADVHEVDDPDLGTAAARIGIFLSVFDVHVNRSPCSGTVESVSRRDGRCLDARDPRAADQNRAATIVLRRDDGRRLAVRQITGLVARRIVCPVEPGARLGRGERYGMIRFGSRTELVVPLEAVDRIHVAAGDVVRGGRTLLARLTAARPAASPSPAVPETTAP